MKVAWQDYLSVGVAEIDHQHQILFDRYNAFFTAYAEGEAGEEVLRLFRFLEAYVATHFADEEKLQLKVGFPDYQKHRQQHLALAEKVVELKECLVKEGPTASLISSVGLLMTGWLIEHISVMDRAIGRFVKQREKNGAT